MSNIMDEFYQRMGFEDAKEAHKLIASLDISTPEGMLSFRNWKECDGTKEGLLEVIERLATLRD